MKLISIVIKSLREQIRSFWILLLTFVMGPFFIIVYFLITESSKPQYNILILNADSGSLENGKPDNHGKKLITFFSSPQKNSNSTLLVIKEITDKNSKLENQQYEILEKNRILEDQHHEILAQNETE